MLEINFNAYRSGYAIWRRKTLLTLFAPRHYLNQCWPTVHWMNWNKLTWVWIEITRFLLGTEMLMLGLLVSAGHQQVWHWLCDINGSWSSSLNHLNVKKCPIQSTNSCLCFLKAVQHKGVNCKSFSYSTTNMNWGSLYNANPRCLKSPTIWLFLQQQNEVNNKGNITEEQH